MKCQWIWNTEKNQFEGCFGEFEKCYGQKPEEIEEDPNVWAVTLSDTEKSDFAETHLKPTQRFYNTEWHPVVTASVIIKETLSYSPPFLHGNTVLEYSGENKGASMFEDLQVVRRNEAQLRLILQSSPIGIFAYDTDSMVTTCNDYFVEMLGSTREKIIGLNMLRDLVDDDLKAEVLSSLNGKRGYYEKTYHPVTGTRSIPVKAFFNPMTDYQNRVIGGVAVIEDVSEKYIKDQQIERLNALLSGVLQSTDDHIFSVDRDLRFLTFNDTFKNFVGKELGNTVKVGGDFLANQDSSFDDVKRFKGYLEETFQGQIHSKSYSVRLEDGKNHHFHTKFIPIRTDGKVTGVAVHARDLTEQFEQQKLIEQHQALLKSITESLSEAVYRSSPDGSIIYSNRSFARLFGYENPDEMLNIKAQELYVKDEDRIAFESEIRDKKRIVNREIKFRRRDGTEFWALVNTNLEVDEIGNEFYDGIIIDITDRKRVEDNIRRNEHLLKSITDNISEGVFRSDDDGGLIFVNNALVEMLGYSSSEELYAISSTETLYTSKYYHEEIIRLLRDEGEIRNLEVEYRRKDGSAFWAYLSCTKTETESGIVYDGAVIDITQRKKDEHRLKISEETYKGIFDHSSDAIYVLDENFRFIDVNNTACMMYGFDRDYFINKTPADLSVDEKNDLNKNAEYLKSAWKGEKIRFEFWAYRSDGSIFPKNVRLRKGVYFGRDVIVAFAEDISEQKKSEEIKNRLIDDLMSRNRDLEHFSHIISHNLRSPVANIMSLAEIFKLEEIDIETKIRVVDGLIQSAHNLDTTVRDLNEILSVRSGALEAKGEVDLSQIVRSAKTSLNKQINQTKAKLNVDLDDFDSVVAIKSYVQSILFNLISNSLKYRHPDRRPVISIKTERIESIKKKVIRISDNGLGMNLDRVGKKIFGLYQRFHNHTDGKGLGLYLVRYQVESMDWKIHVESTPDVGTMFIIEIPN
jgi:PAS domain S-box-containing protein